LMPVYGPVGGTSKLSGAKRAVRSCWTCSGQLRVDREGFLVAGNAGEDENAARAERAHRHERQDGGSRRLVDQIEEPEALRQRIGGDVLAGDKVSADSLDPGGLSLVGSVVLSAFGEVENALMDEHLTVERLKIGENALSDRNVALKLVRVRFDAGSVDLLSVLQIQAAQIASQSNVIKLRSAGLANRIDLHLALGGSFDLSPASQ
jgi:hypothetical protein